MSRSLPPNTLIAGSTYEVVREEVLQGADYAEIAVEVFEDSIDCVQLQSIPARVVVTASDGSHPDGTGDGVYADGRFFTDGHFCVTVPAGPTEIFIQSGPNYIPLTISKNVSAGQKLSVRALLYRWFSPEQSGWYSGDNHVHSQHDLTAKIKTGLAYTALQGRANGLSYITESGSHVSYENMEQLSTDNFLLKFARELGAGCYIGHFNTPGIECPLQEPQLGDIGKQIFPGQVLVDHAHQLGGAVIYTHPLTPPHQLHWMGAAGAFSDAVLGKCADLFDVDSKATELLWFSILNLGNRVACSSYTDSALERLHTLSPGDRRVYCRTEEFSYPAIVEALRQGRTFATNGGPLFAFFKIDDLEAGDTAVINEDHSYTARVEIRSLYPLDKVEIFRRGQVAKSFEMAGSVGQANFVHSFAETEKSWYVARVEDAMGNWCISSPIYFEPTQCLLRSSAASLLFEISNHGRFVYLRPDFYAHWKVTVSHDHSLAEVHLLKDGRVVQSFTPAMGNELSSGKMPVTEMEKGSEYGPGWVWYPETGRKVHFQADCPVADSGWYSVRVKTHEGTVLESDAVYFDSDNPYSHELSVAHLWGKDTRFELWGYGEEMLLEDIKEPYEDRWWYPNNSAWKIKAAFGEQTYELQGNHPYLASSTTTTVHPKLLNLFKSSKEERTC